MSKVRIHFKKGGSTEIKVEGAPGNACRTASGPYLQALGGRVVSDQPTADASMAEITDSEQNRLGS